MNTAKTYRTAEMTPYARILHGLLSEQPRRSDAEIVRLAAERLAEEFLQDKKGRILSAALAEHMEPDEPKLAGIDIETLQASDALLMALAAQKHAGADFGPENGPRLNGLLKYQRFANLRRQADFADIVGRINALGITPMAGHNYVMKQYRPDGLRYFDAVELIALSREDHEAIRREFSCGYTPKEDPYGFEAIPAAEGEAKLHVLNAAALHPGLSELAYAKIAARSEVKSFRSARCYFPSPEDTILLTLNGIFLKLKTEHNFPAVAFDIYDLAYLTGECGISWDAVRQRLQASPVMQGELAFTACFLGRIHAGLLPGGQTERDGTAAIAAEFLRTEQASLDYHYRLTARNELRRVVNKIRKK